MPYPRFTKAIIHYFMSQHKLISKRQGSSYYTINNDGILDKLKFINKGEEYQVYGKPILRRGKGAQGTKAALIPKKATFASKKKKQKKKVLIHDESSDEESEEHEKRLVKKPKAAQFEIDTQKAMKANSDEGAGTSPEVLDESKEKSEARYDLKYWGSTNGETFLFDDKNEKIKDIPWKSTNDDESEDDDKVDESDDDKSIDIEKTDDEWTDTEIGYKDDEELKDDEEQKGDDQARDEQLVVPISTTLKETHSLLQSTSSHFVSSNFGNQFINSPNASLIGTILEKAEEEINSLLDIQIQQDVLNI
ncbi:hypothetical protein Tco_0795901 [Tanacetum coccineum]